MILKNVVINRAKSKTDEEEIIEIEIVKRLSEKYNKKQLLMLEMFQKSKMFGYNIEETKKIIKEFEI